MELRADRELRLRHAGEVADHEHVPRLGPERAARDRVLDLRERGQGLVQRARDLGVDVLVRRAARLDVRRERVHVPQRVLQREAVLVRVHHVRDGLGGAEGLPLAPHHARQAQALAPVEGQLARDLGEAVAVRNEAPERDPGVALEPRVHDEVDRRLPRARARVEAVDHLAGVVRRRAVRARRRVPAHDRLVGVHPR